MTESGSNKALAVLVKTFPKLSETFILGELSALRAKGVDFTVLSLHAPTESPDHPEIVPLLPYVIQVPRGFEALCLHTQLLLRKPWRYIQTLLESLFGKKVGGFLQFKQAVVVTALAQRQGIGHLHTHYASQPASVAQLVRKLSSIPYSISAHAKDIYLSAPEELRSKLRDAEFTVTCTAANRDYLKNIAGDEAVVELMYHGIDGKRFSPDPRASIVNLRPSILSVGRLREKKGFPVLIEACRRLRDMGVHFQCRIVGYGPEHDSLLRQIADLKLNDCVRLLGKLDHSEVQALYRDASLFVLPCRIGNDGDRDGIPNVLLEAMAMELPVISTRVSGIPEVLRNGINGLMVEQNNPEALATAMHTIISKPAFAQRLGQEARRTVLEMFCADANIIKLCMLLQTSSCSGSTEHADHAVEERQWVTR